MSAYIDITLPVKTNQLQFPGDEKCRITLKNRIADGDGYNRTHISMSTHTGTHIDAPYHFDSNGKRIHEIDPDCLIGRAKVLDLSDLNKSIKKIDLLKQSIEAGDIVLIKTKNSNDVLSDEFKEDFIYFEADAAEYFAEKGILTLGFDYLSVDAYDSMEYPAHHILLKNGIVVIEGLMLKDIAAGDYEIAALPLKILDGDGAPARVMIRPVSI